MYNIFRRIACTRTCKDKHSFIIIAFLTCAIILPKEISYLRQLPHICPEKNPVAAQKSFKKILTNQSFFILGTNSWKIHPLRNISLKISPIPWISSNRKSRNEDVMLASLWLGHICLIHPYQVVGLISPSSYPHCQEKYLSVHYFSSCPQLVHLCTLHIE